MVDFEGMGVDGRHAPEIRIHELIGILKASISSLDKVAPSPRLPRSLRVHILNTSELQHLLRDRRADNPGTPRRRDEPDLD